MPSNKVRDIIFYNILDQMRQGKDFFVVNADFVGRPFIDIKKDFPQRFVQVGIAEQNMVAIASGLALAGKRVVTFSPNPFVYLRAYDQLRNAVSAMNLSVTIVANGMGLVNPGLGVTHFTTEDYQMISLLPNMEFFTVTDERMAERVASYLVKKEKGPAYVCIDFDCDGFLPEVDCKFEEGFRYLRRGSNVLLIAQGYPAKIAAEMTYSGIGPAILEIFRRPFDMVSLLAEMKKYERVIVCEEHQLRGGLASELLERLNDIGAGIHLERSGINYKSGLPHWFGSREYWMKEYGIDQVNLRNRVDEDGSLRPV